MLPVELTNRWQPFDDYDTPACALDLILPYLRKESVVWECAWGRGVLARHMQAAGLNVVGGPDINYYQRIAFGYDIMVTNPPWSDKDGFLRLAYWRQKPFAFLLPLTALEGGNRSILFRRHGIQLLVPNKRIQFLDDRRGCPWSCAWFCWKLNLPSPLTFVEAKW